MKDIQRDIERSTEFHGTRETSGPKEFIPISDSMFRTYIDKDHIAALQRIANSFKRIPRKKKKALQKLGNKAKNNYVFNSICRAAIK